MPRIGGRSSLSFRPWTRLARMARSSTSCRVSILRVQVFNFKQPSSEDLDHDFLWCYSKCLPERGRIGIFNRSYYEEVLVVRVHPEILARQKLPEGCVGKRIWDERLADIANFEDYLTRQGTLVLNSFCTSRETNRKSVSWTSQHAREVVEFLSRRYSRA